MSPRQTTTDHPRDPREPEPYSVEVEVASSYVPEQSKPEAEHYVFAYEITLRNLGLVPARLQTRHWVITDANGKVEEVRGEGVVGERSEERRVGKECRSGGAAEHEKKKRKKERRARSSE